MNMVDELLRQTEDAETPRIWIKWGALSAISAVTSFNVFLDKYYYRLSPNVYSLLIGKSGLGKGLPVYIAKQLAEDVDNTRVISGRNSIEAVILELSKTKSRENKPMLADSRGFFVSGEFSNFIIQNPQALTILTEWYDTHFLGDWPNTLKSTGVEKLKKLNITMLGACSPPHFKDFVKARDVEGGFCGRTMLVYAEKRYRVNSLTEPPEVPLELNKLSSYMKELSQAKGEFKWSSEGKRLYRDWYARIRSNEEREGYTGDKTGTDQRIQDHVCKVAMLTSLSKNTELILTEEDVDEAIKMCTLFSVDVKKITLGSGGRNPLAEQTALLLNFLIRKPKYFASREEILQKFWNDISSFDLDNIEATLIQASVLEVESEAGEKLYKLTKKYVEQTLEYIRKKKERAAK